MQFCEGVAGCPVDRVHLARRPGLTGICCYLEADDTETARALVSRWHSGVQVLPAPRGIRASRVYLGPRYPGLQGVPGPTVPRPPGFTWAYTTTTATQPHQRDKTNSNVTRGVTSWSVEHAPTSPCRYSGLQGVPGPSASRPPGFTWAYTTTTATQPHQREKTNSNGTRGVTSWSVEHAPTSPCRWNTLWPVEHAPTFSCRWNTHRPSRVGGTRTDPPAATVGGAPHDDGITQNRTFRISHSRENSKLDSPSRGNNPRR